MKKALILAVLGSTSMLLAENAGQTSPDYTIETITIPEEEAAHFNIKSSANDQPIERKISELLTTEFPSKDYSTTSFEVSEGKVILRGFIDTAQNKQKIEEKIRQLSGVKEVENQLNVSQKEAANSSHTALRGESNLKKNLGRTKYPQDKAKSDSHQQINDKIRDKLSVWFIHMYRGIVLDTENGVVTVKGFVNRIEDVQKVSERIRRVEGVKNIDNQLLVKPK